MGVIIEIRYDKHVSFREPIARIRLRGLQVGYPRLILNRDPCPYVTRYNLEYHRVLKQEVSLVQDACKNYVRIIHGVTECLDKVRQEVS